MRPLSNFPSTIVVVTALTAIFGVGAVAAHSLASSSQPESFGKLDPSSSQEEALADGVITYGEYEAAIDGALECAESQGVRLSGPELGPDGVTLTYSVHEGDLGERSIAIFDVCYESKAHSVDLAYQTSPEVAEARTVYIEEMSRCIFGERAGTDAEADVIVKAPHEAKYDDCRAIHADPSEIVASVT